MRHRTHVLSKLPCSPLARKCLTAILPFFVLGVLIYNVCFHTDTHKSISRHNPDEAQFHLVISHYNTAPSKMKKWIDIVRSMPNIQELGLKVVLYTKHQGVDLARLKELTEADEVVQLSNIGREGGTYLHHLLEVYDKPPRYTMFSKASPAGQNVFDTLHSWFYSAIRQKLGSDTGFLDLCENTRSHTEEFVVSGERITARPRWIYEHLRDLVNVPEDHWTGTEEGKAILKKPDTRRKALFEQTIEKVWTTLFGCAGQGDQEGCQSSCATDLQAD